MKVGGIAVAEPTPGPWEWVEGNEYGPCKLAGSGGAIVIETWGDHGPSGLIIDNPADRNLIAGAPDLLAVCEQVAQLDDYEYSSLIVDAAKAAIAKARGLKP